MSAVVEIGIDQIEEAIDRAERLSFRLGTTCDKILSPEWYEREAKLMEAHKAAMALIKERLGLE